MGDVPIAIVGDFQGPARRFASVREYLTLAGWRDAADLLNCSGNEHTTCQAGPARKATRCDGFIINPLLVPCAD
eukprot:4486236-Heterocapsa_arctica.AAC.1